MKSRKILYIVGFASVFVILIATVVFGKVSNTQPATQTPSAEKKEIVREPARILFFGDMMYDRYIRRMARQYGEDHTLSCLKPLIAQADITVANLEGPITNNLSTSEGTPIGSPENYRFTFPSTTAQLLKKHDISIVSLGNNHSNDFASDGITQTRQYLDEAGVAYFGGVAGNEPVYRQDVSGWQFSFVSYNQFGGDSVDTVAARIAAEKAAGRTVLVYTHWGEEYVPPTQAVRDAARAFVTAGAALIIGSHPHIVQESEVINGVTVYYSLGNAIFDQYFDETVSNGLAVLATITEASLTFEEIPLHMKKDGQTCPRTTPS